MNSEYIDAVIRYSHDNPELEELEQALDLFLRDPQAGRNQKWVAVLLRGLRLSPAVAAERMQISRQSFYEFSKNEHKANLATLRRFAESIDCDFVYGFVPKRHENFAQYLVSKALPLVLRPGKYFQFASQPRFLVQEQWAMASRINKYLAEPAGKRRLWGSAKAVRQKYSWLGFEPRSGFHEWIRRRLVL